MNSTTTSAASQESRVYGKSTVADRLRRDIVTGILKPGTLIRDQDLAQRYKTSLSPVREAVIRLTAEHLIEKQGARTKLVARFDRKSCLDQLALFRLVSLAAFEWGGPNVDAEGLRVMREHMKRAAEFEAEGRQFEVLMEMREFCGVIMDATDNPPLTQTVWQSYSVVERMVMLWSIREFSLAKNLKSLYRLLKQRDFEGFLTQYRRSVDLLYDYVDSLREY